MKSVHEKNSIRINYSDYIFNILGVLDKDALFWVHYWNIQTLAKEICNHIHPHLPTIMAKFSKLS